MLQYQKCDPSDPMCAMMECGHSMTSLKERAMDKKCDEIVKLIEQVSLGKVNTHYRTKSLETWMIWSTTELINRYLINGKTNLWLCPTFLQIKVQNTQQNGLSMYGV